MLNLTGSFTLGTGSLPSLSPRSVVSPTRPPPIRFPTPAKMRAERKVVIAVMDDEPPVTASSLAAATTDDADEEHTAAERLVKFETLDPHDPDTAGMLEASMTARRRSSASPRVIAAMMLANGNAGGDDPQYGSGSGGNLFSSASVATTAAPPQPSNANNMPRSAALVLLDRLATGYPMQAAIKSAQDVSDALKRLSQRRQSTAVGGDVPPKNPNAVAQPTKASAVAEASDGEEGEDAAGVSGGNADDGNAVGDDASSPLPASLDSDGTAKFIPSQDPAPGTVRITAARDVDSTFLRETYVHAVEILPTTSPDPVEEQPQQQGKAAGGGGTPLQSSATGGDASSSAGRPSSFTVSRASQPLAASPPAKVRPAPVFSDPSAVETFFTARCRPLLKNLFDGEDVVFVFHGPAATSRTLGVVLPLATATQPVAPKPASTRNLGSSFKRGGAAAGQQSSTAASRAVSPPSVTSGASSRSMSRTGTPAAPTPSLPLDGRYSPHPPTPPPPPPHTEVSDADPTNPVDGGGSVGRNPLRKLAAVARTIGALAMSGKIHEPASVDTSVLHDALLFMLKEGRARSTTPTYAVRIWVSATRCSASMLDPGFEDMLAGTEHGPVSDSNGTNAAPVQQPASPSARATPVTTTSSSRGTPTPAAATTGGGGVDGASKPAATSSRLGTPTAPKDGDAAVDENAAVPDPNAINTGPPIDPNARVAVAAAPSGRSALVVSPLRLYAVQNKRDVDIVCRRLARQAGDNHHVQVTVVLRQDCPAIAIPSRVATLRLFVYASTAHDSLPPGARRGPFTRDELLHAVERLSRHDPYPLGTEPPMMADHPLKPASRSTKTARTMLDLMLSSVNQSNVAHVMSVLCCSRRAIGGYMSHVANASAFPLTTSMTRLVPGIEHLLHEFLEDERRLREQLGTLKSEVSRLTVREERRRSQIASRAKKADDDLASGMFSSLRRSNNGSREQSPVALEKQLAGDAEAVESDDDAATASSGEAEENDAVVTRSAATPTQLTTAAPKPPSAPALNASTSSRQQQQRQRSPTQPQQQRSGSATLRSARFAPDVRGGEALGGGRTASQNSMTQPLSITSPPVDPADDDDPLRAQYDAARDAMEQNETRRQRTVQTALNERAKARDAVADLREQIAATTLEINRRAANHAHHMEQRETLHARELEQYSMVGLERRLKEIAAREERSGSHAMEDAEVRDTRHAAMVAKARRAADRVKIEASQSFTSSSAALVRERRAACDAARRDCASAYRDILRLTGRRPEANVGGPEQQAAIEALITQQQQHQQPHKGKDSTSSTPVLPESTLADTITHLNARRRAVALQVELSGLFSDVAHVYRSVHPTVDAMWRRGDFHEAAERRRWSAAPEVGPLGALTAALGSSDTFARSLYLSIDRKFHARRAVQLEHADRNPNAAPRSEHTSARNAAAAAAQEPEHLAHLSMISFCEPSPGASTAASADRNAPTMLSPADITSAASGSFADVALIDSVSIAAAAKKANAGSQSTSAASSRRSSVVSHKSGGVAASARVQRAASGVLTARAPSFSDGHPRPGAPASATGGGRVSTPRLMSRSARRDDPVPFTPSEYRLTRSNSMPYQQQQRGGATSH